MSFSPPFQIGAAFGPGSHVVICATCGALVLDVAKDQSLHQQSHTPTDPDERTFPGARRSASS